MNLLKEPVLFYSFFFFDKCLSFSILVLLLQKMLVMDVLKVEGESRTLEICVRRFF